MEISKTVTAFRKDCFFKGRATVKNVVGQYLPYSSIQKPDNNELTVERITLKKKFDTILEFNLEHVFKNNMYIVLFIWYSPGGNGFRIMPQCPAACLKRRLNGVEGTRDPPFCKSIPKKSQVSRKRKRCILGIYGSGESV